MTSYHYNPSTGEPGYCRAKPGNCPFIGQGSTHSESKEDARRAYEEFQANGFQSLLAQLMVNRSRVQRRIVEIFTNPALRVMDNDENGLNKLIAERNAIERAMEDTSDELLHSPRARSLKPQQVIHEPIGDDRGEVFVGIGNNQEDLKAVAPKTAETMVRLSEEWLSHLSPLEAKAVLDYSGNAVTANGNGEILSKAVLKAPPLEPTKVYSGLSAHVANDVLRQFESGGIILDYPISSTLNPAQVNSFMETVEIASEEFAQRKSVALEIETTRGGSMSSASHSPHEAELLLPAGSYEVISVRENVTFLWEANGLGREADLLIKVRRIEEG